MTVCKKRKKVDNYYYKTHNRNMIILKIITIIFLYIFGNNLLAQIMVFENFKDKELKGWEFISDQVMGGISSGKYKLLEENDIKFLRMTGDVSLENNGGFVQVRKKFTEKIESNFKVIRLNARGNNSDYFVHLRTSFTLLPWQYYQAKFSVSDEWKFYNLDLKNFQRSGLLLPKEINPKLIKSLALVAFGREHVVKLDVANISLLD